MDDEGYKYFEILKLCGKGKGGKGMINCESGVEGEEKYLRWYVRKRDEVMLRKVRKQ